MHQAVDAANPDEPTEDVYFLFFKDKKHKPVLNMIE